MSAALFQSRLVSEIAAHSPSVNITTLANAGLSDIAKLVGSDRLRDVLLGYDEASHSDVVPAYGIDGGDNYRVRLYRVAFNEEKRGLSGEYPVRLELSCAPYSLYKQLQAGSPPRSFSTIKARFRVAMSITIEYQIRLGFPWPRGTVELMVLNALCCRLPSSRLCFPPILNGVWYNPSWNKG